MTTTVITYAIAILTGTYVINILAPDGLSPMRRWDLALRLVLGAGAGIGLSSSLYFIMLLLGVAHRAPLMAVEGLALCGLFVAARRRPRVALESAVARRGAFAELQFVLFGLFALAGWNAIRSLVRITLARPEGEWDAWAIWNARARFLTTAHWRAAFSPELAWSHTDYPLLLPGWNAHFWTWTGSESVVGPALTGVVFTVATISLLVIAVGSLRSAAHAWLAGLILLGCTWFVGSGSSQLADIPSAFYFLATMVVLATHDQSEESQPGLLILAGAFAGMGAWTKNEGQVMCASAALSLLIFRGLTRNWRSSLTAVVYFAAGALPFAILIAVVKFGLSPTGNWLLGEGQVPMRARLMSISRYKTISVALWEQTKFFAGFAGLSVRFALVFYALVVGVLIKPRKSFPWLGVSTLSLMILASFMIYVMTPFDLAWHLESSLSRLVGQWLPTGLFLYFMLLGTPEEARAKEGASTW